MRLVTALVLLLPLAVGTQTTAEATTVAETTEAPNATTVPFTCSGVGSNSTRCEEAGDDDDVTTTADPADGDDDDEANATTTADPGGGDDDDGGNFGGAGGFGGNDGSDDGGNGGNSSNDDSNGGDTNSSDTSGNSGDFGGDNDDGGGNDDGGNDDGGNSSSSGDSGDGGDGNSSDTSGNAGGDFGGDNDDGGGSDDDGNSTSGDSGDGGDGGDTNSSDTSGNAGGDFGGNDDGNDSGDFGGDDDDGGGESSSSGNCGSSSSSGDSGGSVGGEEEEEECDDRGVDECESNNSSSLSCAIIETYSCAAITTTPSITSTRTSTSTTATTGTTGTTVTSTTITTVSSVTSATATSTTTGTSSTTTSTNTQTSLTTTSTSATRTGTRTTLSITSTTATVPTRLQVRLGLLPGLDVLQDMDVTAFEGQLVVQLASVLGESTASFVVMEIDLGANWVKVESTQLITDALMGTEDLTQFRFYFSGLAFSVDSLLLLAEERVADATTTDSAGETICVTCGGGGDGIDLGVVDDERDSTNLNSWIVILAAVAAVIIVGIILFGYSKRPKQAVQQVSLFHGPEALWGDDLIKARPTSQTDAEDKTALITALAVEVGESCDGFSFFGAVDESKAAADGAVMQQYLSGSNVTDTKLSEYFIIDLEANSETYDGFAAFDDLSADAAEAAGKEALLEDEICSGFLPIELGDITTEEPQEDASVIVVEVKKEPNQEFGVQFADRPGGGVYVCGAIPGSPGATSSGLVIGFDVIEANFQRLDESSSMLDVDVILTNAENDLVLKLVDPSMHYGAKNRASRVASVLLGEEEDLSYLDEVPEGWQEGNQEEGLEAATYFRQLEEYYARHAPGEKTAADLDQITNHCVQENGTAWLDAPLQDKYGQSLADFISEHTGVPSAIVDEGLKVEENCAGFE